MKQRTSSPAEYEHPTCQAYGDQGLLWKFGDTIAPEISDRVMMAMEALTLAAWPGVLELVPGYCSVLLHYDPLTITFHELAEKLDRLSSQLSSSNDQERIIIEVPVCYGDEFGPDMEAVYTHTRHTEEEVIALHTLPDYRIYMIGFSPGFPFLGGMAARLATPRLSSPRTAVPAGSIGIANTQTGIYPLTTPGGWQLIGRTPLSLFRPGAGDPFLLKAGRYLRFVAISREEYLDYDPNSEPRILLIP